MRSRLAVLTLLLPGMLATAAAEKPGEAPLADPFAVVEILERFARRPLWPGFDPTAHPFAIYDGRRTLLWRHPAPPDGFEPLASREGVQVYAGRHPAMRWNSNVELVGVRTATLLLTLEPGRSADREAGILLHEIFHVFSKPRHLSWRPDEMQRYSYPIDDEANQTLLLLEEEALARALETEDEGEAAGWAALALEWRRQRREELAPEHRTFETALEMQEGTAVYLDRLARGESRDTERLRRERTPEQIRWRFYDTGAALAAILDRMDTKWKARLEEERDLALDNLLESALRQADAAPVALPAPQTAAIRARAEQAIEALQARRTVLRDKFLSQRPRVIVTVAEGAEPLRLGSFDPLGLEVLPEHEMLHTRRLTLETESGSLSVENPSFARGSTRGLLALTTPVGGHPLLHGVRQVVVAGFSESPRTVSPEGRIEILAEGFRLVFESARLRAGDAEIHVVLQPVAAASAPGP